MNIYLYDQNLTYCNYDVLVNVNKDLFFKRTNWVQTQDSCVDVDYYYVINIVGTKEERLVLDKKKLQNTNHITIK